MVSFLHRNALGAGWRMDFPDNTGISNAPGFLGVLRHANTVQRLYDFQDKDGTVAFLADIPAPPVIPDPGMANPMLAPGDFIVGGTAGAPTRFLKGSDGQLLGMVAGGPAWVDAPTIPDPGIQNPLTAQDDLFIGGVGGAPSRLPKGSTGQHLITSAGGVTWADQPIIPDPGMPNPMTAPGDLITGGLLGEPTRLAKGSDGQFFGLTAGTPGWCDLPAQLPTGDDGQILTLASGQPDWVDPPDPGIQNPLTDSGDIFVGGATGAPSRLGKGTDGQHLVTKAGAPAWEDQPTIPDPGIQNPLTAQGDIFVGGAAGAPSRLAKGTDSQQLVLKDGVPAWEDQPAIPDPGMTNPMTARGSLIAGGATGTPQELGIGDDGQVLTVVAGVPAWETPEPPADPGMANPMTSAGDLITGGSLGAPARIAKGTEGQHLAIVSGAPTWADPAPATSGVDAAFVIAMAIALG